MFIVDLSYKVDLSIVDTFIADHKSWLEKAYTESKFLCSGAKNPRTGGIIISLIKDLSELKELIAQDPFYINEVADYTITEFYPSKYLPDFSNFATI